MDSIQNMRRIVERGLTAAFPSVRFIEYGAAGASGTGELAWVRPEVDIEYADAPNEHALDCTAVFTVDVQHADGVDYSTPEAIAVWLNEQRFTDAIAAIMSEDADFVRPLFLWAQLADMPTYEIDDRYRRMVTSVVFRITELRLGTVNNRSHPDTGVLPTQVDARINGVDMRIYP